MLLKNAVVLNDKFQLEKLDIKVSGDKIEDVGINLSGSEEIDLTGKNNFRISCGSWHNFFLCYYNVTVY